ncbi:SAM-dependent methyltransferase [Porphyromonas macacae]|uniref:Ribosomal RNA small subunit methyltransferase I n=1 Tax=Porphyromonas macacae TaxID=28115 RepID=A0A0A2E213_9PORP|nr:SAM-dependent methyltransferase [Porphyromonas macacae]KGN72923.1 SAM-dependent methyltransferase [Porphyromonas macacae]SUB89380.1 Ribosomal RNA small subunit methyltransferase I [Porphyromonas macacae]
MDKKNEKTEAGTLYLIPVTLGDVPFDNCLPFYNREVVKSLKYFIVEQVRTARRFIRAFTPEVVIDELTFFELNKHTHPEDIENYLLPLTRGESIGIISEAGCPAIADPGADVVAIAQKKEYKIIPLIGPSSILLSLMASGFNGQRFAFRGYLPIDEKERASAIKDMEQRIKQFDEAQIFIETPYRNEKMLEQLIRYCHGKTRLCIAAQITCPDQYIRTMTIDKWRQQKPPLYKVPAIFLLG